MIQDRWLEEGDLETLAVSLALDPEHAGTTVSFFTAPGTVTKVYEDKFGPVLFARGAKVLRLDIQYVSNTDVKRNMKAMLEGFPALVEKAKENGFTEICFLTQNPLLQKFCVKYLGFETAEGTELRRFLQ